MRALGRFALTVCIGAAGGLAASRLGTPLPWLLGALLPSALLCTAGAPLAVPRLARLAGQWGIGVALGLQFTPESAARLPGWAPWIALAIGWAILLGLAQARALARWGGVDAPTAFFGGAVGGASEMAFAGARAGGRVDLIAAVHALRLLIVVTAIPLAFDRLGLHGVQPGAVAGTGAVDPAGLAALVALTVAVAAGFERLRVPSAWVLGPLAAAGLLSAAGLRWSAIPPWMSATGQVLIGLSLGTRFGPDFFARAPRLMTVTALSTVAAGLASALFGLVLGQLAGLPAATMVLATSPGGIAEMSLTAKVLGLGVPVVATFHVLRMSAVVLTAGILWRAVGRRMLAARAG